jgi:hypothetical protein
MKAERNEGDKQINGVRLKEGENGDKNKYVVCGCRCAGWHRLRHTTDASLCAEVGQVERTVSNAKVIAKDVPTLMSVVMAER